VAAPAYERDPRVDAYTDALPSWQQDVCRRVRDLVHAVDPQVEETVIHDNATARTVAVREGEALNEPALRRMFEQIVANNRAGGWRGLKRGA